MLSGDPHFSYEIKLIPMNFLCGSCEITAFQTGPEWADASYAFSPSALSFF
jgi:hypothetical protein